MNCRYAEIVTWNRENGKKGKPLLRELPDGRANNLMFTFRTISVLFRYHRNHKPVYSSKKEVTDAPPQKVLRLHQVWYEELTVFMAFFAMKPVIRHQRLTPELQYLKMCFEAYENPGLPTRFD